MAVELASSQALDMSASRHLLNVLHGRPVVPYTMPLKLHLLKETPPYQNSARLVGVQIQGHVPQVIELSDADENAEAVNTNQILFENLPYENIRGFEIWDSSPTPRRIWWGASNVMRLLYAGSSLEVRPGKLRVKMRASNT